MALKNLFNQLHSRLETGLKMAKVKVEDDSKEMIGLVNKQYRVLYKMPESVICLNLMSGSYVGVQNSICHAKAQIAEAEKNRRP